MIKFKVKFSFLFVLVVICFLVWRPMIIQSETLTLSTYYPAPYAGYDKLLTSGNTYLARNSSAEVRWGSEGSKLSSSNGGYIYIKGSGSNKPYVSFANSNGTTIKLGMEYVATPWNGGSNSAVLAINSDLYVSGSLRNMCSRYSYSMKDGNSANKTYCGGNNDPKISKKYVIIGLEKFETDSSGIAALPRDGNIICCKLSMN